MYYRVLPCIIVVLHNVNTRASDTPQIRRDTTVIHVFRELSHELCRYISDTSTIRPIHSQYVIDTRIAVGRCRYSSIHGYGRYAADTQPIRRTQVDAADTDWYTTDTATQAVLSLALCPKLKEPLLLLVTRVWGRLRLTGKGRGRLGRPPSLQSLALAHGCKLPPQVEPLEYMVETQHMGANAIRLAAFAAADEL